MMGGSCGFKLGTQRLQVLDQQGSEGTALPLF